MGELGIAKDLRDRLQNHALNDVSSKHYDRYEYLPEKRRALELWERRLLIWQRIPWFPLTLGDVGYLPDAISVTVLAICCILTLGV